MKVYLQQKVENIVSSKGEMARFEQCFQKSSAADASKCVYKWVYKWVDSSLIHYPWVNKPVLG